MILFVPPFNTCFIITLRHRQNHEKSLYISILRGVIVSISYDVFCRVNSILNQNKNPSSNCQSPLSKQFSCSLKYTCVTYLILNVIITSQLQYKLECKSISGPNTENQNVVEYHSKPRRSLTRSYMR